MPKTVYVCKMNSITTRELCKNVNAFSTTSQFVETDETECLYIPYITCS